MVWICISLMITDVKHHYICLFAICISSLEKMSIETIGPFLNKVLFFCLFFSCMNSLYILDTNPLQNIWIAYIFSTLFHFFLFYFLDLCNNSSCYFLLFFCVYNQIQKSFLRQLLKRFLPIFSSSVVSGLLLKA